MIESRRWGGEGDLIESFKIINDKEDERSNIVSDVHNSQCRVHGLKLYKKSFRLDLQAFFLQ